MSKSPYDIIKHRLVTEKATMLSELQHAQSNRCVKRCEAPKAVFLVDKHANKTEIAWAIEKIYAEKKVKVVSVNTILLKPKRKRVRGRLGMTSYTKKAIVTFEKGDVIDDQV